MIIAISALSPTLDSDLDPRFGRCSCLLFIDTETLEFVSHRNPNINLGGGAGIQTAQMVAEKGAQCVLTGNCGPNAYQALTAAGIRLIVGCSGKVIDIVHRFNEGAYKVSQEPNVIDHYGEDNSSSGMVRNSFGQTPSFQSGRGMGRGMGMGRGGRGRGMGFTNRIMPQETKVSTSQTKKSASIAQLQSQVEVLSEQMKLIIEQIKELESKE